MLNRISIDCPKKILAIILLFLLVNPLVNAQQATIQPKLLTRFRFEMLTGGVVIINGLIGNNPDTLNFVLDTGSGGISLDSATADYLKLELTPSNRMIKGIAGIKKVRFAANQTLRLPGLHVNNLDFHTNDYEILTNVYGMKIDGIIGYSLLSRYIVKMNYENNTIEFWTPGKIRYQRGGYLLKSKIANIPVLESRVKDEVECKSRFYFDTGAGLCLLLSEKFESDSGILNKGKKILVTQAEGLGGKKSMKLSTVREVKFGPYKFKKVPVLVFADDHNVTSYPFLGGLIGNDLLRRFNLVMNYPENEIHLFPNSHFNEPFDYSYTGLSIYFVNGQVVIEDVIEGSPGEKAGLKPGDIIVGIGTNFSGNIQAYKALLQTAKLKLKIVIKRDEELFIKNIRVESIL